MTLDPTTDSLWVDTDRWIQFSFDPEAALFRSLLETLPQAQRNKIYQAATLLVLARERIRKEQQQAMRAAEASGACCSQLILNTTEVSLLGWLRDTFRQHDAETSQWVERFINRVSDVMLMSLVDSMPMRQRYVSKRVWWVSDQLSKRWESEQVGQMLTRRLTPWPEAEYAPNLSAHVLHYTLLFLEAYLDGVFPGQTPQPLAHTPRLRANCWQTLFEHAINHG